MLITLLEVGVDGRAEARLRARQGGKPRKRLAPSETYEVFVQVLTQQATQREAAERWGVDRSTVVHVCRTAKQGALDALAASVPGRSGKSPERLRWRRRARRSSGCVPRSPSRP